MSNYIRHNEDLSMALPTNITPSDDNASFFSITAREWPILIGAVVGAVGLVVLILCAISIWFCCQYANNSNNTYRLSEEDSDSCHNLSYDENHKASRLNEQRNFSKIDRVLLLRPSLMDLSRESGRNLGNLSPIGSMGSNHLAPINYPQPLPLGGQSPALLNARQIDAQSNEMLDTRYLSRLSSLNGQSVVNLY